VDANQNFDGNNNTLYNSYILGHDSEVINVKWVKDRYLPRNGNVAISGDLNMSNNKINNIINSTNNFGAINKKYVDDGFAQKADKLYVDNNFMKKHTSV